MKSIQLYSLSTIDFTLLVSPMLILSYLDLHLLQNQHIGPLWVWGALLTPWGLPGAASAWQWRWSCGAKLDLGCGVGLGVRPGL